ncbi:MAG: AAA family ATPase [Thermodesulfobacteriota bacterium]
MNFWHMQLHRNDTKEIPPEKVRKILIETSYIGLGDWDKGKAQIDQFKDELKVGDIVAIRSGKKPIALVAVIGEPEYSISPNEDLDWFSHRREVKILDFYKNEYGFQISKALGTLTKCANLDKETSKTIISWYEKIKEGICMEKAVELLKYKHQIILQGPPGTGKTRLAKLIATELTKPISVGNPINIIDDFIKKFDLNDEPVKGKREKAQKLLTQFYERFPIDKIKDMTLEEYCVGKGDRDNFCWWIERGLKSLGYYFPGTSRSYCIYWKKETEDYSKHGFIRDIEDNEEAMKKLASLIDEVIKTKNPQKAKAFLGDSLLLKLLNTYYPDEFFPINSEKMIDNALKIFSIDYKGLDVFQKNKKLNEIFVEKKNQFKSQVNNLEFGYFIWEKFNLKEGEDIDDGQGIVAKGEYHLIQFHPAYTYEDFVRGIVATTTENNDIAYNVENKILAEFVQKAIDNPNGYYVLIIDEINRANLPAVFGELIYALEYRAEPVTSIYEYEGEQDISLPKNLYIIGTMNTADRSVGHIDYALRRRFGFFDVLPDETVIKNEKAKILYEKVSELFTQDFLSPDFKENDVKIGHSYFILRNENDENELKMKLDYEIKPILKEYLKDGILLERAKDKIEKLNV